MMENYFEALERLAMPDELHVEECKKLGIGLTEDFDIVEQALLELKSIKESEPGKALECLENLFSNVVSTAYTRESSLKDFNTIKNYILKAQALEKEKIIFKHIHNTKVKTPLVSIFNGLNQEERHKFIEHIYYNWEKMKEALEDKNEELVKENTELKAKAQKEHKVLEIIKEYQVDVWLLKQCDYENYIRIRKEAMVSLGQIVNENGAILEDEIPEEYFDLVKRWIE